MTLDAENTAATMEVAELQTQRLPLSSVSSHPKNLSIHPKVRKIAKAAARHVACWFTRYDITDDLEQDFYLAMVQKKIGLSEEPAPWLYRNGTHWLIDKWRSRQYNYAYDNAKEHVSVTPYIETNDRNVADANLFLAMPESLGASDSPADKAIDSVILDRIKTLIGSDDFALLSLSGKDGYTGEEIAASLSVKRSMVCKKSMLAKQVVRSTEETI